MLGRLIRSPGSPRRREGSGALEGEIQTNFFSPTFLSPGHIIPVFL